MTPQTASRETVNHPEIVSREIQRVPRYRVVLGALILALAVGAALAAGGWGLVSSLTNSGPPARIGEDVEVPGGLMRVDKVTPEHMAPMQMGKFAKQGMNMSMPKLDMVPDGYRRFTVDVTLIARGGNIGYGSDDFTLSREGEKTRLVRSQLGEGSVENGSSVAGNLVFQVPEKAKGVTLEFDGGRPVGLDLPASKGENHGH